MVSTTRQARSLGWLNQLLTQRYKHLSIAPVIKCLPSGNQAHEVTWSVCFLKAPISNAVCRCSKILVSAMLKIWTWTLETHKWIPKPHYIIWTTRQQHAIVRRPCTIRYTIRVTSQSCSHLEILSTKKTVSIHFPQWIWRDGGGQLNLQSCSTQRRFDLLILTLGTDHR
jgi:hypothetical protein